MKWARKHPVLVTVILLAVAGGSFALWPRPKVERVRLGRAERFPEVKALVNGSGEIRTKISVDIQAEIAGVIIDLPVREGDRVTKGQVLLKVDPFQTDTDVQAARAALSALEAEAAGQAFQIASSEANAARDEFLKKMAEVEKRQAETNLARAKEAMGREKKLLEANLVSPDQFEVAETQFKLNEAYVEASSAKIAQLDAQINATRANSEYARTARDAVLQRVEGARSSLRRSEDLLGKTTIRSPIDGVIVKLNVDVGERAVPGILSNPQATLMTIADFSIIEAELKVDETDIVNVKKDDPAEVIVDALPETRLSGTVVEVGNAPILLASMSGGGGGSSQSQEGKDFKVIVRILNPPDTLRPGMSCESDITTGVKKDVLVVPIQALTMREVEVDDAGGYKPPPEEPNGAGSGGRTVAAEPAWERRKELQGVFMAEDGRARFRPVKTGITGEMEIEVLEGLKENDEVVIGPLKALRSLREHDRVQIDRSKPYRRPLRRGAAEEDEEETARR